MNHIDTIEQILAGELKADLIARFQQAPESPLDAIKHILIVASVWPGTARVHAEAAAAIAYVRLRRGAVEVEAAQAALQWYKARVPETTLQFDAKAVESVPDAPMVAKGAAPVAPLWSRLLAYAVKIGRLLATWG